jgi:hypothetical protein
VVEHSTHKPKKDGSNPASERGSEKNGKITNFDFFKKTVTLYSCHIISMSFDKKYTRFMEASSVTSTINVLRL